MSKELTNAEKIAKYEEMKAKQYKQSTKYRIKVDLWLKAAKAAEIPEPTEEEVMAEIKRRGLNK